MKTVITISSLIALVFLTGCDKTSSTFGGAAVGTAAGAGIGNAMGGSGGATILGAVIGGLAGAAIGNDVGDEEVETRIVERRPAPRPVCKERRIYRSRSVPCRPTHYVEEVHVYEEAPCYYETTEYYR